jgi:small GTP-binding protein
MERLGGVPDSTLKLIALGEAGVGKTSILNQWLHGTFSDETPPTIAAGLSPVQLLVDDSVQSFHIWDTAGTPQYRSVVPMYCRAASIAIIVFDVTQESTFLTVDGWYAFVKEQADPVILLVGNKIDAVDRREVDIARAQDTASRFGCAYLEVSAKTNEGISVFGKAVVNAAREFKARLVMRSPGGPQALRPKPVERQCAC